MSIAKAIEYYARDQVSRGYVSAWFFDEKDNRLTLFVPEGTRAAFPSVLEGVAVRVLPVAAPLVR
jgi:hypothetical protein